MSPEDALSVLDQMAARAAGNRADHQAVAEAVQVLSAVVSPEPETDDD